MVYVSNIDMQYFITKMWQEVTIWIQPKSMDLKRNFSSRITIVPTIETKFQNKINNRNN